MLSPGLPWFCGTVGTSEATRWKQTFSDRVSGHLHSTVPTRPGCPGPAPDLWTRLRGSPGTPRVMGVCLPRHATSAEGAPHGSPKCPPSPLLLQEEPSLWTKLEAGPQSGRTSSLSCPWDSLQDRRNSPSFSLGMSPRLAAEQVLRWDQVGQRLGLSPGTEPGEGLWADVQVPPRRTVGANTLLGDAGRPLRAASGTRPTGLLASVAVPPLVVCVCDFAHAPDVSAPPFPHLYRGGNNSLIPTMG